MNINRAEIRAGIGEISNKALKVLPRELRSPMAGARLLLTSLTVASAGAVTLEALKIITERPAIVLAADLECKISKFVVLGFEFADHPEKGNRAGLVDPVDLVVGQTEFGAAVLDIASQQFKGSMVVKGDHAEVSFKDLAVKSTTKGTNGKPAAEVKVSFAEDKLRQADNPLLPPQKSVIVECGKDGIAWGARYATESDIRTVISKTTVVDSVGARIDMIMEELFGKGRKFGLTPKGEDPKQNLAVLKANLDQVIAHAKEVRGEEKKAATTPTATASPTNSPTRVPSPTASSTATGTAAPRIPDNAPTPTVSPKQPGSGGPDILGWVWNAAQTVADLPARVFRSDAPKPLRGWIDLAGWLILGSLLTDRPSHVRTRIWNTVRYPDRRVRHVPGHPGIWTP